ncbi:MAG: response regulator, partial [Acidobacteriota bacterium]|nr:response regulator [Acidobacteriota bacterium]
TVVLGGAAAASAALVSDGTVQAMDIAALVLALVGGLTMWHFFTTGVVRRLRALEGDATRIEGAAPVVDPAGRDEIGRLAARLEEAAGQVRRHIAERDRAREELTDILTDSPVVALRYDVAARRFSYASPNIERLLGITAETAMTDTAAVVERFHPDDEQQLRVALVEGRGGPGDRLSIMLRVRRDPSADEWFEVEAAYLVERDGGGVPRTVSSYLVDVSERHAAQRSAEERRSMLESIFHASPDTIVVRDAAARVVLTSAALADLVDVPPPVAPDRLIEEAYRYGRLRRQDVAALDEMLRRVRAGEPDLPPVVTTGRAGQGGDSYRTFETRARPILDHGGRVIGTVTVSRDITERMKLERSLRRATVAAERASEAKSQFLSRMSHELRTPLNAILGFAQLLQLEDLPADQASSVDQIERAGHHLLSLINEVLDIARIEAGQLTVSPASVRVGDVLGEVTALLAPVAESAAVTMLVDRDGTWDEWVRADRQRLLQVLLNLGSNAVKYNEAGGTVSFRTTAVAGGRMRFSVQDTGPGIPLEQQDLLFLPFSRLGAERSGVEGTGVGLALSKQLVELMGGAIGVESAAGYGSTFWVELQTGAPAPVGEEVLPVAPEAERPVAPGRVAIAAGAPGDDDEDAGDRSSLVVLQVEDDASNAALVSLVLARRPEVRLLSADDARVGLELARRHRPHLLLLDLHLPDLPGDQMLYRVKATPELADTEVVVLSADATPDRIRRMLDLGAEGYLTKPVDVEALLELVDDLLQRRAASPG